MAKMHDLSAKLQQFNDSYDGIAGISYGEFSSALYTLANTVDTAYTGFNSAGSDETINSIKNNVKLVKEAVERIKSHVDGDMASLLGHAGEAKSGIDEILETQQLGEKLKEAETKTKEDGTKERIENDQVEINYLNERIDYLNRLGEARIDAMAAAMNSVAFGITGNMKVGGTLGTDTTYDNKYLLEFDEAPPEKPEGLNLGDDTEDTPGTDDGTQTTSSDGGGWKAIVGGVVSGPLKRIESILDTGCKFLAEVTGWDVLKNIADFELTDWLAKTLLGEDVVNSSAYKTVGTIATTATDVVTQLWGTTGMKIADAIGIIGDTALDDIIEDIKAGKWDQVGEDLLGGGLLLLNGFTQTGSLIFDVPKTLGAVTLSKIVPDVVNLLNGDATFLEFINTLGLGDLVNGIAGSLFK